MLEDIDKRTLLAQPERVFSLHQILDALPIVAFTVDPYGHVSYISSKWQHLSGHVPEAMLHLAFLEIVHAEHREHMSDMWWRSMMSGDPLRIETLLRFTDRRYRWFLIEARPQRHEITGMIECWFGTATLIDEHKRVESAVRQAAKQARERAEFAERLIQSSDDCIQILDLDANLLSVSENGRKALDITDLESVLRMPWLHFWQKRDRDAAQIAVDTAKAGGIGRFVGYYPVKGEERWWDIVLSPIMDEYGRPIQLLAVSRDVTDQRILEKERKRTEAGLRVLEQASLALLTSLNYTTTIKHFARAVVAEFATLCIVNILNDAGGFRCVLASVDSRGGIAIFDSGEIALDEQSDDYLSMRSMDSALARTVLLERWLGDMDSSLREEHRHNIMTGTALKVPIVGRDGLLIGEFGLGRCNSSIAPVFENHDPAFAEEMGRRLGAAILNARNYQKERRIALTFQRSALVHALPKTAALRSSAEYRPGSNEAVIGGDWYDMILLPNGCMYFSLGDVLGDGLRAAVAMSKIRQAMETAAMVNSDPVFVLDAADRALQRHNPDLYATAIAGVYDEAHGRLRFASAGHLPPVLRTAQGHVHELACQGTMLGLRSFAPTTNCSEYDIAVGDICVLFTDGLVESSRNIAEGYERLYSCLRKSEVTRQKKLASYLIREVLQGDQVSDDTAVLTMMRYA